MCLQALSVRWAFINAGTIWVPNTCAQNVSFWLQTGFDAVSVGEGYLKGKRAAESLIRKGGQRYLHHQLSSIPEIPRPLKNGNRGRLGQ